MFRRIRPHHALFALGLLLAVLVSGPASASIGVGGSGEPRFTNSGTNTAWLAWTKPSGADYHADLAYVHGATGQAGATGATGATGPFGPGATGETPILVDPGPLVEGHTYGVCAFGKSLVSPPDVFGPTDPAGSCDDALVNGKRTSTIIDRTRPSIQVKVNNGAALTRASVIPVRIDYTDNLAFPFPANFVCLRGGLDPATAKAQCDSSSPSSPQYAFDQHCSSPGVANSTPGSFVNYFICNVAAGTTTPDGPVTFCAIAADAAIPDNPSSSNQSQTADKANLSFSACGSTVLDRTAPGVVVIAPAGGRIGETLAVSALGQDATSGLAGEVAWAWGDDSSPSTGAAATHVFTTPGTYAVAATMSDAAGNVGRGTASVVITTGAASAKRVRGGSLSGKQLSSAALIRRAGAGGHVKRLSAGDLQGLVPARVRLKRTKSSIPISLAAGRKGSLTFSYAIRGRRIATAGLQITRAGTGTFALGLPKRAPTGKGVLLVRWTPAGGKRTTVGLDVTLVAAKPVKKRRSARKSTVTAPYVTGAPLATLP